MAFDTLTRDFTWKQIIIGDEILDALESDFLKKALVAVLKSLYLWLLIWEMGKYLQSFCDD